MELKQPGLELAPLGDTGIVDSDLAHGAQHHPSLHISL